MKRKQHDLSFCALVISHLILNPIFVSESYLTLKKTRVCCFSPRLSLHLAFFEVAQQNTGIGFSFPCFNSPFLIPVLIFKTIWIQEDIFFLFPLLICLLEHCLLTLFGCQEALCFSISGIVIHDSLFLVQTFRIYSVFIGLSPTTVPFL